MNPRNPRSRTSAPPVPRSASCSTAACSSSPPPSSSSASATPPPCPLIATELTRTQGRDASLIIAACIVGPQIVVALLAPSVGSAADRWGRRPLLLIAFAGLPLRATIASLVSAPLPIVAAQLLDGITGAGIGVLLPLIAADLTRGTNRFNLVIATLSLGAGIGATFSTALAGIAADIWGPHVALFGLALIGLAATALVGLMPDTTSGPIPASVPA